MKKTLAILMALVMVLGACTFASAEVKTYKVGISIYQYTDNFMTLYRNEIAAYFKTLDWYTAAGWNEVDFSWNF